MTPAELRSQIIELKAELNSRSKYGITKMASADGTPIPSQELQDKLFAYLYKLSKSLTTAQDEEKDQLPSFP